MSKRRSPRPRAPRLDCQAGVSLIELVAALTLIAATLAISGSAFRLLGGSGARGNRLIAHHDMVSRGLAAMQRDVERLERVVVGTGSAAAFVFEGDARSLEMVVVEPPVPSQPGPYLVRYTVGAGRAQDGQGTSQLVRSRQPFVGGDGEASRPRPPRPTTARRQDGDDVTVLEGPFEFRFSYLAGPEAGAKWLPTWRARNRLPSLIRLELRDTSGTPQAANSPIPPIVLRPRIDAELDCIVVGGKHCTIATGGAIPPEAPKPDGPKPDGDGRK